MSKRYLYTGLVVGGGGLLLTTFLSVAMSNNVNDNEVLDNSARDYLMSVEEVTQTIGATQSYVLGDRTIDMWVESIDTTQTADTIETCAEFRLSSEGHTLNVTGETKYFPADSDRRVCWSPS